MRGFLAASLILLASVPARAAEPLDVDRAAKSLSVSLGEGLVIARGTGSVVSVVLDDIAAADPFDASDAQLMTQVLRLNLSTHSFALFQERYAQGRLTADLRISGELLRHGDDRRVFVRLVNTASGQVLMTAGETLLPLAKPAAPPPIEASSTAPARAMAASWWFTPAMSVHNGSLGFNATLAWREPAQRWEVGLDVGHFARTEMRRDEVQIAAPGSIQARDVEHSVSATYIRPKASLLAELRPGLTARAGAGVGLYRITQRRKWPGLAGAVYPKDRDAATETGTALRAAFLTEAGLSYAVAEGWEAGVYGEHVLAPLRGYPLSFAGWAARLAISARLPDGSGKSLSSTGLFQPASSGRELWVAAGPLSAPQAIPGFRVSAAVRFPDRPLELALEYGRLTRISRSFERLDDIDWPTTRTLNVSVVRPTVSLAAPLKRLGSAAPAGFSGRVGVGLPIYQLREQRYAHRTAFQPPIDEGRTRTTFGLSLEMGLAYAWRFLELQTAVDYAHGFEKADLVNLRYDGWALRAGVGVRLF